MQRHLLLIGSARRARASTLAGLFAVAIAGCDDPALEAELAAEDAELAEDAEDADDAPAGPAHEELALAAADQPSLDPPESVCCSIDWQILFQPRVRLSTMSAEGCSVYNWPPSVTARVAWTVYHTGGYAPRNGLSAWMAPNTVTFVPLSGESALYSSYCTAYTID
ncbi:hypothetical protein OV079_07100 [Nannocystis pusilla]|uniref:Lipoprotein n=1 Tax=Nannocystis pusilla TaxID=889268 RepID=A0A9X3EJU4_9BACT|nr:hypothetical protein [Nannocystis pusilla]MCY1005342.1 hypothetical protein [Nannocystis pusilla]